MKKQRRGLDRYKTASAPRPNAIPYKVNMMCPLILKRSMGLLKVDEAPKSSLAEGGVPDSWKEAEGISKPNEQNSKTVNTSERSRCSKSRGRYFSPSLQNG